MSSAPEPGRLNIRTRIALTVIVLVGFALSLVGVTLNTVERATTESQVLADLWRVVDEFEVLATEGVDPRTGRQFDNPSRLLEVALQRAALKPTEGQLGLVTGQAPWVAAEGVQLRPEKDPALMAHLTPLARLADITAGEFTSDQARYRYVVVPVIFEASQDSGSLIRVVDMGAEMEVVNQLMRIYVLVAFGSMLLVAAFTWVFAGRLLRPIELLREAAESIGEDDLTTRVPVSGADDLTRLTITMNGMLDRVSESVEAQRRLLDDVGHELRTPVTVVRGHLELMDIHDPLDVAATQALALDELDRMGGLVTDLLTLAKSDGPDFVVPDWADVALLTDATFEKARALGQHRWVLSQVAVVDAWLDGARITQAWLQLAANAVKYSDPGSRIEIGSAVVRGELQLWVRDEGIGIAAEDLELIQSRFGRTQAGRVAAEGVGLGLSIVGSILKAHGGRLQIESQPGVGSRFTMINPLAPKFQEDSVEHDLDH